MTDNYFVVLDSNGGDGTSRNTSGTNAAFASAAIAEAAVEGTLTDATIVHCSGRTTGSNKDTAALVISGSTTTAANYLAFTSDDGFDSGTHGTYNGKGRNTGPTFDDNFYYIGFDGTPVLIRDNHARVEDLQVSQEALGSSEYGIRADTQDVDNDVRVNRNKIRKFAGTANDQNAIRANSANLNIEIHSNLILWEKTSGTYRGIFLDSVATADVWNNVVYNAGEGMEIDNGVNTIKNNAFPACTTVVDIDGGTNTFDYNATDTGTAISGDLNEIDLDTASDYVNEFEDVPGGDFRLVTGGSCVNAGEATGQPTLDNIRETFVNPDVGAFAFGDTPPVGGFPPIMYKGVNLGSTGIR